MVLVFCHVGLAWWDWTRRERSSFDLRRWRCKSSKVSSAYSTLSLIRSIYVPSAGSAMSGGQERLWPPHHETHRLRDNTV